ncbi:radical SAM protein [Aquabacterium sp. A7-Y]|uniref:radical SAM protein n=1 Tax=Aquabacterium sp. A7-Y TaxID=1349605 RepID=UPI00223DD767|nr:radical SAM protein [Aquabacterium sp. A7-Y]MCW7536316.1 radical SAM protein [Aquabacterium sp. A7-Y]
MPLATAAVPGPLAPLAPPLPRFAQIEPTGSCNLACRMCTVTHRPDAGGMLSLAQFERLLEQLPQLEELHLQGLGEPMLNPAFFDMVELAVARGIRVTANTNLTLLTPERAARCVSSGLHTLSVSIDAARRELYEAIRVKASFHKVVRNLERLSQARREAAGSRLQVRLVMVLMRQNLDELASVLRLAQRVGVRDVLVQRLSSDLEQPDLPERYIPIRDYVEQAELVASDRPHAIQVFAHASRLAAALGVTLHLPRLSAKPGARGCSWPWDQLYLTARGDMLPCCMVATPDRASFGNVLEEGLTARWHGEAAQRFRAELQSEQPPPVCRHCALYHGAF